MLDVELNIIINHINTIGDFHMSYLQSFLKGLEDYELAYFYRFRYDEFLSGSKAKIDNELATRGLNMQDVNFLLDNTKKLIKKQHSKYDLLCPRCKSSKIFINGKNELRSFKGFSYEKSYNVYNCQVCKASFSEPISIF